MKVRFYILTSMLIIFIWAASAKAIPILDRMHGLDLYDSQARWYDSLLGRTSTMDPLAEKYYSLSPYLWCAGNPVKYGDERGDTIAVLGFQQKSWRHIALLIQDENNKWRYYSVNGDNVYFPGCLFSSSTKNNSINQLGSFSGGKETDDLGDTLYNSIDEFLNSESNESDYAYDVAYKINTKNNQDKIIYNAFRKISESSYDITSNNCATAVAKSLNKAGIITYMGNNNPIWTIKLNSYIPSRLFNDIVKHNSNGKYIYK